MKTENAKMNTVLKLFRLQNCRRLRPAEPDCVKKTNAIGIRLEKTNTVVATIGVLGKIVPTYAKKRQ